MKNDKRKKGVIWWIWFLCLIVIIGVVSLLPVEGGSKYQLCAICIELLLLSLLWIVVSNIKIKKCFLRWIFISLIVVGFYLLNIFIRFSTYDLCIGKDIFESGKAAFVLTVFVNEIIVILLARHNIPAKVMMLIKDISDSNKIEDNACEINDKKLVFSNDFFFVKDKEMVVLLPFKNRMLLIESNLFNEVSKHYKGRTGLENITNAENAFNKTSEKRHIVKIINNTIDLSDFCDDLDLHAKIQFKALGDFYVIDFVGDKKNKSKNN